MDEVVDLERVAGHPSELWIALKERVQNEDVKRFSDVADGYSGFSGRSTNIRFAAWRHEAWGRISVAPTG